MLVALALLAEARTWTLCANGCDRSTLSSAVSGAGVGDVIEIHDGTYIDADIDVTRNLTITAVPAGAGTVAGLRFDGGARGVVTDVVLQSDSRPALRVRGSTTTLTVIGVTSNGGASPLIDVQNGTVAVSTSDLSSVDATGTGDGAAVEADRALVSLQDVTVSGSLSDVGAIHAVDTTLTLARVVVSGNGGDAGGIGVDGGTLAILDARIEGNVSTGDGAGVLSTDASTVTIQRTTFCANLADGDGGALHVSGNGRTAVAASIFAENDAGGDGGGVFASSGLLSVDHTTFAGNAARIHGGGAIAADDSDLHVTSSIIANVDAGDGIIGRWSGFVSHDLSDIGFFAVIIDDVGGDLTPADVTDLISGNPQFVAFSDDGSCAGDDLRLLDGTAYVESAPDDDPDATPADLGAYGGPSAGGFTVDADGDGEPWAVDCDDGDALVHRGADERCDGFDEDCDGDVDDDAIDQQTYYRDSDGDGYGTASFTATGCSAPANYVDNADDCNDGNPFAYPMMMYVDADNDFYGTGDLVAICGSTAGYTDFPGDCDDADDQAYPGAPETCDPGDDDCDGEIDEDAAGRTEFYADSDSDGFGGESLGLQCTAPDGALQTSTDCDDDDGAVNPDADELCNAIDDDCDEEIDESAVDATDWWVDADADGYGSTQGAGCAPDGSVDRGGDCDDADPTANPDGIEVPGDGIDQDCDGHDVQIGDDRDYRPPLEIEAQGCGCQTGGGGGAWLAGLAALVIRRRYK